MLAVENLVAGYQGSRVLHGISFAVGAGEVVTLLGRNGMGKTTTVRAIMGLVPPTAGRIAFAGADVTGLPPHRIASRGIGLVPEGRQVFPTLTVEENLVATAANRAGGAPRWTLPEVLALFPRLAERRRAPGARLSGGEQQMLAIGRALMTNPRLLILDEATEGLAPIIRAEIWAVLARLRAEGQAILLIDKNLAALTRLADRHVVIEKGRVVWTGTSEALSAAPEVRDTYLHV
ncbi:ABC transporter ATP-binding protein [Roseomonas alkaliterrae]|uniref:Branched-chain amino acid transport system ATP-binding protein n=1 Tax=Neoroseomonas alkaliterrae TaxID=1452450 RepID=A0A840XKU8_9PROT|nr:ABC transporter ATP-binding protein [Neoroseomonas alkaliterrae]MBB5689158.1 branched-chain amino acid transport system ATP-binding protein [Neoroseomonas alkaliterrae]MBR0675371.1 ABC transporter ATP-binding protein [Neoroseomonas alkaliterrae]